MRKEFYQFIKNDPLFVQKYWTTIEEERELAFQKLKKVSRAGFLSGFFFCFLLLFLFFFCFLSLIFHFLI